MPKLAQLAITALLTVIVNFLVWLFSINVVGVWLNITMPPLLEALLSVMLFGIGLGQLLYIIPICIYLAFKRRFTWFKGVIIGAILTALLNGSCWLLIAGPSL